MKPPTEPPMEPPFKPNDNITYEQVVSLKLQDILKYPQPAREKIYKCIIDHVKQYGRHAAVDIKIMIACLSHEGPIFSRQQLTEKSGRPIKNTGSAFLALYDVNNDRHEPHRIPFPMLVPVDKGDYPHKRFCEMLNYFGFRDLLTKTEINDFLTGKKTKNVHMTENEYQLFQALIRGIPRVHPQDHQPPRQDNQPPQAEYEQNNQPPQYHHHQQRHQQHRQEDSDNEPAVWVPRVGRNPNNRQDGDMVPYD